MAYLLLVLFLIPWLIVFGITCNLMPKMTLKNIGIAFVLSVLAIPTIILDALAFLLKRLSKYIEDTANTLADKVN